MLIFPPYFFLILAIIGFVIGYVLAWFTQRPVRSIGVGVFGVVFVGLFILDWTIPDQPADAIWLIAMLGALYGAATGLPALFGAAVGRNLKKEMLK
ncbi:hypothetical protein KUV75_04235 [Qipengyuania gaetbuli]|uniref:hypothetical protein n=1 Tax=Qipengyuania gaetbuli TaxID=266952 RepID=UPI001C99E73F|nr:hypothetical protein [Qipengyuania gaetbuli]MBY6014109.1 hypothetical protein [Qipengyuania gaetbuli]